MDNVTGLVWEVKTDDGGLHDRDNGYRWGGITALANGGGTYYSDWDELVNGSRNATFCGFDDWRVPTIKELETLRSFYRTTPVIDTDFFPNTMSRYYWSASAYANGSRFAWVVNFVYGSANGILRSGSYKLRLVRGGQ